MATKPYDKGSANDSVPALTDSGAVSYPVGAVAYGTEDGTVTIVGAAGLPVQAGSGAAFPVTDNGGSLTVDAPVGTPVYVRLSDGANPISTLPVVLTAAAGAGGPVRNATNYIDVEDPVMLIGGRDSGDTDTVQFLKVNSSGVLAVQDNGGSLTVDGTVAVSSVSGSVAVTGTFWQATQPVSIASTVTVTGTGGTFPVTDSGGSLTVDAPVDTPVFVRLSDGASAITTLPVSLASVPSHDVTNAGTFAVQVSSALPAGTNAIGKLAANSGVTIGAVEIAATQTLSTVTTVGTVTTVSTLTGGGVAHDGVDSGNPVKVGARAISSLASVTIVSAADRTDAMSDLDGAWLVRSGFPLGDLTSERVSNTDGASTAFSNFGATASVRNYVTAITIFNSSATAGYVDFRDGTGGSILFTVPIPAGSGAVLCNGGVPLFRTSANTALAYDVSAALTTVYISVSGFRSKV